MNPAAPAPKLQPQGHQFARKVFLLVMGVTLSAVIFLALDWFRSIHNLRASGLAEGNVGCRVADPVRHHALKPDCKVVAHWGSDSYDFSTNNLGFRDENVRDVPLADPRPRILLLGDSFTEAKVRWRDTYVGRVATQFPQYDFLNGAVDSYSPSNYLNVTRMLLAKGVEFDEVIVFIDISDVQDEAAFYRDLDASGAVIGPKEQLWRISTAAKWQWLIARYFSFTNYILEFFQRRSVGHGNYHLTTIYGDAFDMERSAWTYRPVNETEPYVMGYAPLGVEGGIAKEKAKMTQLWDELAKRTIPISVVVDPWPAQIAHDTADSRQVRIWRDWCRGKCKRFISVFPEFLAIRDGCPKTTPGCWYLNEFVFGDSHYNAAGNAVVAAAIINNLGNSPPIKRSDKVASSKRASATLKTNSN